MTHSSGLRSPASGLLAGLVALVSCSTPSLSRDLAGLRAEIDSLERDLPPESPLWIREGDNAFARHLEDFSPHVPHFVYNHVLSRLKILRAEDIATEGPYPGPADPAAARGKFWKLRGLIGGLRAQKADPASGLDEIHSATVWIDDAAVLVHVIEKPPVLVLERDSVEFSGLFLKILRHRAKDGSTVDAPFFVAKSLRKFY